LRRKMIAGNWKMYQNRATTSEYIRNLEEWLTKNAEGKRAVAAVDGGRIEIVIAPPFTSICSAVEARGTKWVEIAAQNVHYEAKGAFTGEISLPMLEEAGCKYVIIGHSERRHVFGEKDDLLEKKLIATLESEILPIFCVGETLEEREAGRMEQVLAQQLDSAWSSLTSDVVADFLTIAYEPVWAIGTGRTAGSADADDACAFIRDRAFDKFGISAGERLRVLYGGSVKPENSGEILAQENIDGVLIGGASLETESFERIVLSAISGK